MATEKETPYSTPILRPTSLRTASFSSSSRSNSWDSFIESPLIFSFNHPPPPQNPITPLKKLTGIPFSWEQTPGIPKKGFKKSESSGRRLLPLPPAGATAKMGPSHEEISPKKCITERDPFFAAMVKCSKDDRNHPSSIWKGSLSDRFGIINVYTSCKKMCAVSESIVCVPRGGPHYLLHDHRRRSR